MTSIITSCINVARTLPLGSGIDLPWTLLKQYKLTNSSIIYPRFALSDEDNIKQTAVRFCFAILLPSIAKPAGYINLGLGAAHFIWCVCNIGKFKENDEETLKGRQEFEKAFIRLTTGVYDLGIGYMLNCSLLTTIIGRATIPVALALFPTHMIQAHHLVFEKAQLPAEPIDDDFHLKPSCLIQQFSKGLVDMGLPEPKAKSYRILAMPLAMGTYLSTNYTNLKSWWKPK